MEPPSSGVAFETTNNSAIILSATSRMYPISQLIARPGESEIRLLEGTESTTRMNSKCIPEGISLATTTLKYTAEEFGLAAEKHGYEEADGGDSDGNKNSDVHEGSLEPERPYLSMSSSGETSDTQGANRLRGGAEAKLKNKPYVVKFGKKKAGMVHTNQDNMDENTSYTGQPRQSL